MMSSRLNVAKSPMSADARGEKAYPNCWKQNIDKADPTLRMSGGTADTRQPMAAGMMAPPKTSVMKISPMHHQKPAVARASSGAT